jgi:hypothetical protein
MANKALSLEVSAALVNELDVLEQMQRFELMFENTTVDARGIADRYPNAQAVKQKQSVAQTFHWYNSTTELEAYNCDISLWDIASSAYLALLKSGSLEVQNTGPETSGIAETFEYMQPSATPVTVTSNFMMLASAGQATFANLLGGGVVADYAVTVSITFAGQNFQFPGLIKSARHSGDRGGVQMQDVVIEISGGSPTTPSDTTSLLYLAMVGAGATTNSAAGDGFNLATGVNTYSNAASQLFVITHYGIKFADKALIEQTVTIEPQGGMVVTAP